MAKGLDIMRIKITGRNIELTDGIKDAVEDKLNKLEKYFTPDTDVYVTLSVEKERQKVEVTIPMKGNYIRSEQVSNDMYVSIDLVEEVIERQLKKYRTKLVTKQQSAASVFKQDFLDAASDDDEEIKIIRSKKFDMKPMYPEDACVQMELLGHDFFVFINAETEDVNRCIQEKRQHIRIDRTGILKWIIAELCCEYKEPTLRQTPCRRVGSLHNAFVAWSCASKVVHSLVVVKLQQAGNAFVTLEEN